MARGDVARELLYDPAMWLANALTLSRIPLAGVFWLVYDRPAEALAVLAGAAASDALDGSLARRARARAAAKGERASSSGEWLDPLADKVFVLAAIAAIVAHAPRTLPLVALACTRELALVPLAAAYRFAARHPIAHAYRADRIGKATTIAQFVTLAGLVARARWAPAAAFLAGALGLAAVGHYVARTVATRRAAA